MTNSDDEIEIAPGLRAAIETYTAALPNLTESERLERSALLQLRIRTTIRAAGTQMRLAERVRLDQLADKAGLPPIEWPPDL